MKNLVSTTIAIFLALSANAQIRLSAESGIVSTQYNDVRAPNAEGMMGTFFSFKDDFVEKGPAVYLRAEAAVTIADRHTIEVTAAPLTTEYDGSTLATINFEGSTFSGSDIVGRYEFNTYRASYRYRIVAKEKLTFELGASLLVRDARIALTQGSRTIDNTDLGYVPLISWDLIYNPTGRFSLQLKGDALVGPVGRAEDIFAGILYDVVDDRLAVKLGYRLIEGGADVDQVYNFAYFHFASAGVVVRL